MTHANGHEEIQVLAHEPWPGFRPAFYVLFAVFGLYLAWILVSTLGGAP